jgi:hypothetical protein
LESKRTVRASHDGDREFITLIASICADGTHLAPALIYQGTSHDLQDTWLDDFDHLKDRAYFACSEKGWSSDVLGLQWLEKIFDRTTKEKADRGRRLLIVDGHSSHVNMRFIDYADANRILLAVLPPHSTHRLQPLDVGLFSPLATYYTQEIDQLLAESQGLVRMTKREFWPLFRKAWMKAFTDDTVLKAFEATGIWPLNPEKRLKMFKRSPTIMSLGLEAAPTHTPTVRALQRTYKQLRNEGHVDNRAKPLLDIGEELAAKVSILQHENEGLRKAIIHEKKKRKRGKAMNLYDPGENEGQALFFSPAKIMRVRERVAQEKQAELQHQQSKSDQKLQAAIARDEKAREAQEKKAARMLARQAAREEVAREKAERQASRQAQRAQKAEEAAKRKEEAAKAKEQRMLAKKTALQKPNRGKRPLEDEDISQPKKRRRTHASRTQEAIDLDDSTTDIDTIVVRLPDTASLPKARSKHASNMHNSEARQISLPMRSGRTSRLPARFV